MNESYLHQAVELARQNVTEARGRPFGAVLVKDGEIIATGVNEILATGDPTAHAELLAIRRAASRLGTPRLTGCTVYASGLPCPMCLSAIYLAGVEAVYFAFPNEEGEAYGLSSAAVYEQLALPLEKQELPIRSLRAHVRGEHPYELWRRLQQTGKS
ncbi:tRNA-specific adenosine deaminase [Paenibacillus sp. J31TS4]|uniref:nucleoside deaminase n=1 Tax=Paenibacillus sp. J31TS4 TaxID=2807195 RepID=UPI001B17CCAA|nr:nucleoside deaminase [Paenibacillus sp. J31TS4]GIP37374.1 tRNA-specific adenosine deaminase [Paenibacillus sp. J31TS4]